MAMAHQRSPRSLSQYATMSEQELSESLVYLTCPICEEVRVRLHARELLLLKWSKAHVPI